MPLKYQIYHSVRENYIYMDSLRDIGDVLLAEFETPEGASAEEKESIRQAARDVYYSFEDENGRIRSKIAGIPCAYDDSLRTIGSSGSYYNATMVMKTGEQRRIKGTRLNGDQITPSGDVPIEDIAFFDTVGRPTSAGNHPWQLDDSNRSMDGLAEGAHICAEYAGYPYYGTIVKVGGILFLKPSRNDQRYWPRIAACYVTAIAPAGADRAYIDQNYKLIDMGCHVWGHDANGEYVGGPIVSIGADSLTIHDPVLGEQIVYPSNHHGIWVRFEVIQSDRAASIAAEHRLAEAGRAQYQRDWSAGVRTREVCEANGHRWPILDYSDKAASVRPPRGQGPLWYGVELEVEVGQRTDRNKQAGGVLSALGDWVVTKHDGSLSYGFEIVTVPSTLEVHREMWPKLLGTEATRHLSSWSTSTCGLHVHVSRKAISQLTLGKMLVFVNAEANRGFIERIAGRTNNDYALMSQKKITDINEEHPRRDAVNLCNRDTVEFRIFRGNISPNGPIRAIEFIDSLMQFCRQSSMRKLGWRDYANYLGEHGKPWPIISAYVANGPITYPGDECPDSDTALRYSDAHPAGDHYAVPAGHSDSYPHDDSIIF